MAATCYKLILLHVCLWSYGQTFDCNEKFTVISDLSQKDCGDGFYVEQYDGCFPGCLERPDLNIICGLNPCPPGYKCPHSESDPKCEIDEDSCFKYYTGYPDNPYSDTMFKPICLRSGQWAAKQCKGDKANGRCFCYDAIGNRLFGEASSRIAENMTCACSRKRAELSKDSSRIYASLHCDSMGNYEPLQCDSGLCWCAESKTGDLTSPAVPEKAIKFLPCYSKSNVGSQYLRQCESEEYAQAKIISTLHQHGTDYVSFATRLICDFDGSYGKYKIINNIAHCVGRDNSLLELGEMAVSDKTADMNCYCARDKKYLKHGLKCQENGNYSPEQVSKDGEYCVDSDGFRKSPILHKIKPCTFYK